MTLHGDLGAAADRAERDANAEFDAAATRVVIALGVLVILAIPRRTRPLAGALYGVALSRIHGAADRRIFATITRLFDERGAVSRRVDRVDRIARERAGDLERRLEDVEIATAGGPDVDQAVVRVAAQVARTHGHGARAVRVLVDAPQANDPTGGTPK